MSNAFELSVAETMVEHNLKLVEIAGNGNCFFSSLVTCLKGKGKKATICGLRQKFSAHLAGRVDELAPFFSVEDSDESNEEDQRTQFLAAVKMIRKDRFWNNQIIDLVVGCATEVLGLNVTIFDIDQEGNVTEYEHVYEPEVHAPASPARVSAGGEHVYEPDSSAEESGSRNSSGAAEPEGEAKVWPTIKLLRQDDNHFNAFVAVSE